MKNWLQALQRGVKCRVTRGGFLFILAVTPDLPSGRRDGTGLVDLAPTVLHHFGVPVPVELEGQSLLDDQPSTVAP